MLLLLFILVPLAEIAMFMFVGDLIGFWPTLAVVLVTAFIGTYLLKQQGLAVLSQAQSASGRGELPINSVIDGVFLLIAGAFLLTPGILTDIIGFSFMIPAVRRFLGTYLYKKFAKNISVSTFGFESHSFGQNPFEPDPTDFRSPHHNPQNHNPMPHSDGPIIDGEIIDPKPSDKKDGTSQSDDSPWQKK